MSTQVAEFGEVFEVSTVTAPGTRRRMGRRPVLVPKGTPDILHAEIVRQAKQARIDLGVRTQKEAPVV